MLLHCVSWDGCLLWSQAMHSIDGDAAYAGIKPLLHLLAQLSHLRQILLLLYSSCCPVCCILALLLCLELAQHPCASQVNLPFARVSEAPQSFANTVFGIAASSEQLQLHMCTIHAACMCCCCGMTLDTLHCLVQGHLKITGSAQQGTPGGLESGPQRPSS